MAPAPPAAARGVLARAAAAGALAWLLSPAPATAALQEDARRSESSTRESAAFLLAPLGARSVGLGGAVVATRGVAEAVLWNPASAASLERGELYYLHGNDFGTESHVIGGAWRSGERRLAAAWYRFDLGSLEATSAGGTRLGELDLHNEAFVLTLGLPLPAGLEAGASYKLVRFVSDCSGSCGEFDLSSTAHAFDVGVIAAGPGYAAGLALRNVGSGLSLGDGAPSDPLPTRLRAGVSLSLVGTGAAGRGEGRAVGVSLAADVEETVTEFDDLDVYAGAEVSVHGRLFGRVGHAWSGRGRRGPSLGVGVRLDRVSFDVGRAFDDFAGFDGDEPLHLSVAVRL